MPIGVERSPDRHGLGRKTAIGEADDERRARHQHASHLGERLDRLLQILYTDAAQRGIKGLIAKKKPKILVEVLHEPPRQARVGRQFGAVHAVADNLGIVAIAGQMADPA